jgi:tetratricopeptide (TPR) repeat protein
MQTQYIVVLLLVVALALLVALPPVRSLGAQALMRLRSRLTQPQPSTAKTGITIIDRNGEEIDVPEKSPEPAPSWATRLDMMGGARQVLVVALIVLLVLAAVIQLYGLVRTPSADQFIVLVAPFQEPDGTISQTGRELAAQLVAMLPEASGGRVVARAIGDPPADTNAALAAISREGADALLWGNITPGGMLDQESLLPLLAYQPNGAFAPFGWEGYAGRFEMPTAYVLARAPINGTVIVPNLLGALADYGAGRVDSAFTTFGALADNYPALAPGLPRAIRGNLFWARGVYEQAAGQYRIAIGGARSESNPQQALLMNNLGAILQDAGAPDAADLFGQAITALAGHDLSALRYNLGIQALRAGNAAEAASSLEIARGPGLLPPGTPTTALLLTLSQAYRLNGQFDQAQVTLDAADRQVSDDAAATVAELRSLTTSQLRAALIEQRALLGLAQAIHARGPLLWELQTDAPLPIEPLNDARGNLASSVKETELVAQRWNRLSAAKDAAEQPVAGRIAIGQAQRAQALLRERQRWQAAIETELGRSQGARKPQGLAALWAALVGDRSAIGQGRESLNALLASQPGDVDTMVLLGRNLLVSGDPSGAATQFDAAASAAPQRPEPAYGQALIALPTDRARARELLTKAISLDDRFFPAHEKLAQIAQEDKDWPVAIEQRRWLAQHRPSDQHTFALAETLQLSGAGGYAEAERLLLPLANANNTDALLALSRLYRANSNTDAARDVLERAARVAPRNAEVAYNLGQLLEAKGDTAGAEAQYKIALDANPAHIPANLALAQLYASTGHATLAAKQYRSALDAGASDPDALKRIGAVLIVSGEYPSAVDAYSRAIKASPNDPELHHGLALANLRQGQLDTAQTEEQKALELKNGAYPEALVGLGDIALQRGQYQDAVQQYNAALAQNDRLTIAYLGLGRVAAAEGNWSVAQAHFRNAVNRDGSSAEAHLWLGESLIRIDDASDAIAEYVRATELKRDYPEAYFGLAQAQMSVGEVDKAQENVGRALQLRPSYAEAFLLQGKLYEQRGADDQAIAAYGKAAGASRVLAEPYYRRALLYIRRDRMDDATSDLESATRIQPNFPEAHYWLGRAYLAQGRARLAREQFQRAVEQRGGNYAEARFYQGIAEEQLGQRTDAAASYQAALQQDNTSVWAGEARTALTRLQQP